MYLLIEDFHNIQDNLYYKNYNIFDQRSEQSSQTVMKTQERIEIIRQKRKKPQYYRLVEGLRDCDIVIYSDGFPQLGKGNFGKCYLGKFIKKKEENIDAYDFNQLVRNDELIAVKVIPKKKSTTLEQKQRAEKKYETQVLNLYELSFDKKINTTNILRILCNKRIESENNYYLVTQYCNHCTLSDLIDNRKQANRKFTVWEFLQLTFDLIEGYLAMYSKKMLHNDLKPQNILIKDTIFKIGDFGLSLKLSSQGFQRGNVKYAALEKLNPLSQKADIDHKSDIYSFGLILYEILYGRSAYHDQNEYQRFKLSRKIKKSRSEIYYEYLKTKQYQRGRVQLQPLQPLYKNLILDLESLVQKMCALRQQQRYHIDHIIPILRKMKSNYKISRDHLFKDLTSISQSQFRFQMENMSKLHVSSVQAHSIKPQHQMIGSFHITIISVRIIKERLLILFKLFDLLQQFRNQMKSYLQQKSSFFQYMVNYIYSVNLREINFITQKLIHMNQKEIEVAKRQDILNNITKLKQNDAELSKQIQSDCDQEDDHCQPFKSWIKEYLFNTLITQDNWNQTICLVLLFNVVLLQENHRYDQHWAKLEKEIRDIEEDYTCLFKKEEFTESDYERGIQLLERNQTHFMYLYG